MTTTDNDRRIVHSAFEKACGARPAEILMEHLPPAGWRDLATRRDVESASLLRTELVAGMGKGFRTQTWKMIGAVVASQSTTMGMIALILR
ncbi:MAG: hypothetical protein RJB57_1285 [Actinomycetota bacterium]